MILSEKDLRVGMHEVTSEWHEGRLFKHPVSGNLVRFFNLPKEERQRLDRLVYLTIQGVYALSVVAVKY